MKIRASISIPGKLEKYACPRWEWHNVREASRAGVGLSFMFLKKIVFKKVLKSFRRVLKSKNSLKS
jgi:hypothetical protein